MSFRRRLRLFFALIVIVPLIALGVVLFALTERIETGKIDAGIGTAARTALGVHREEAAAARPALRRIAADSVLRRSVVTDRLAAAERRMRKLLRGRVIAIALWSSSGQRLAIVGRGTAVAWSGSELVSGAGSASAVLTVSVTDAATLARRIQRLANVGVAVFQGGRQLATTVSGTRGSRAAAPGGGKRRRGGRP